MSARVSVQGVSWGPSRRAPLLLQAASFDLDAGRTLGIVGPNGAGKTTLLRLIYGFNRPWSGQVEIDGQDLATLAPRAVAQLVAAVLQEQPTDFALTVRDIVALGRVPHRSGFSGRSQRDEHLIAGALARLDLEGLAHRTLSTLSGGERQRVMVARALAQEPRVLVLDEPTNHLDIRHQLEVMDLIGDLDLTIVTSLHDLNLAARVCDDILVLKDGHQMAFGPPDAVLNDALVSDTFSVLAQRELLTISQSHHFSYSLPN